MFKQRGAKKTGLNILIIGCGKVGTALTRQLCKEGHDITVIDKNADKIEMNVNQYDVMGICGNGASYSVLMEAGVEIAVAGSAVFGAADVAQRVSDFKAIR